MRHPPSVPADPATSGPVTLFQNVRVFDGKTDALSPPSNVLVRGNKIEKIWTSPIPTAPLSETGSHRADTKLIDCGGRAHAGADRRALARHARPPPPLPALDGEVGYIHLAASAEAERTLMRGFTTVRDVGGPAFALKKAIDEGLVSGPRIYPSGAMITATGGHGDLRPLSDVPAATGSLSSMEQTGGSIIADGPDAVRLRVREQLLQGASQLKLVASGGVSSLAALWTR